MKNSEKSLVLAYLEGDPEAFRRIYQITAPALLGYLLKKTNGQKPDAEEVLQNVYLKFHKIRDRYDQNFALLQWLFMIARSEFIDFYRKNKSLQRLENKWAETQKISESMSHHVGSVSLNEWMADWRELSQGLSEESKEVFLARALEEESFEEMSQRLKKSSDSLRQIFSRSRRLLEKKKREKHE